MAILWSIIFGLVVGLIARALIPGRQRMGVIMTALLGIAGSFVGGALASLFTHHRVVDFHSAGLIGSVIGAILLLLIASRFSKRNATT
jgi:uncharacterized membrane protein YeaQ/YmgE (transglycosylase-associated protein family)